MEGNMKKAVKKHVSTNVMVWLDSKWKMVYSHWSYKKSKISLWSYKKSNSCTKSANKGVVQRDECCMHFTLHEPVEAVASRDEKLVGFGTGTLQVYANEIPHPLNADRSVEIPRVCAMRTSKLLA